MKHATAKNNGDNAPIDAEGVDRGVSQPTEHAIRERAYSIHESDPGRSRSPELDWLEAEQQLKTESGAAGNEPKR